MFRSIGFPELVVILVVAVLLFGGKKIPEVAKGLGEGIKNFKNALKTEDHPTSTKRSRHKASWIARTRADLNRLLKSKTPARRRGGLLFSGWLNQFTSLLLLGGDDRVFYGFRDPELHHFLSGDLDGLARRGIAAHPGLAVHAHQAADAGNHEHAVLLGFANGQFRETCDELLGYLGACSGGFRPVP